MYVFCIHKDVLYYCSNSIDASLLLFNDVETTYTLVMFLLFTLFFFNDTATTEIYTLSLHDALPISAAWNRRRRGRPVRPRGSVRPSSERLGRPRRSKKSGTTSTGCPWWRYSTGAVPGRQDRKSTRLNSSHLVISYAVFCLKKKKNNAQILFGS